MERVSWEYADHILLRFMPARILNPCANDTYPWSYESVLVALLSCVGKPRYAEFPDGQTSNDSDKVENDSFLIFSWRYNLST